MTTIASGSTTKLRAGCAAIPKARTRTVWTSPRAVGGAKARFCASHLMGAASCFCVAHAAESRGMAYHHAFAVCDPRRGRLPTLLGAAEHLPGFCVPQT